MKLWIRTNIGEKTAHSVTADAPAEMTADALTSVMRDVLLPLDVPTPAILPAHVNHLKKFNTARFKPADFIEHVDFDAMTVEILRSDREKRPHSRNPLDEA